MFVGADGEVGTETDVGPGLEDASDLSGGDEVHEAKLTDRSSMLPARKKTGRSIVMFHPSLNFPSSI
ncbi:hypothetical protein ACFQMJ_29090 [Cohnella cellulosilytica]|uniref:Uncharacterized protein n=1 Tax=Cohnella cellulosilytica TaxID=986710 RepID=A0ABW2FKK8_9BACL